MHPKSYAKYDKAIELMRSGLSQSEALKRLKLGWITFQQIKKERETQAGAEAGAEAAPKKQSKRRKHLSQQIIAKPIGETPEWQEQGMQQQSSIEGQVSVTITGDPAAVKRMFGGFVQ